MNSINSVVSMKSTATPIAPQRQASSSVPHDSFSKGGGDALPGIPAGGRYALFDFDGTLSRGFISLQFLDFAHDHGLYADTEYKHQNDILQQYKSGAMSYDAWVEEWGRSWARGIKGQRVDDMNAAAKTFFESFRPNIYKEASSIVAYLAAQGLTNVMVSAGIYEVVDVARQSLGLNATIATRGEVVDGRYTGELTTHVHTATGKGEVVDQLAAGHGQPAYAFGDSTGDISMLSRAHTPVCLNPNAELTQVAEARGWTHLPISDALGYLQAHP